MVDVRYGRFASDDINEFYLEASRGRINGVFTVHKFGLASAIDALDGMVDIWDGVSVNLPSKITPYNWIEGAPIDLQVSSSSTSDVGVHLHGEGLDEDWKLVTGEVTLNGQTPVTLGVLRNRIFRAYNAGSQESVGIIYVSDAGTAVTNGVPDDDSKIRLIVHPEYQQTQMALYTVPAGHSMYITHGWANLAREDVASGQATVHIYRRVYGGVFRVVHTLALSMAGSSGDHRPYLIPIEFKEKEDIIYRTVVSTNNMAVSAGFHALVIKN